MRGHSVENRGPDAAPCLSELRVVLLHSHPSDSHPACPPISSPTSSSSHLWPVCRPHQQHSAATALGVTALHLDEHLGLQPPAGLVLALHKGGGLVRAGCEGREKAGGCALGGGVVVFVVPSPTSPRRSPLRLSLPTCPPPPPLPPALASAFLAVRMESISTCPPPPPPSSTSLCTSLHVPPLPPLPALASAFLAVRMESISSMKMTLGCRQWGEECRGLRWGLLQAESEATS